jgi:predicted RNA-binding Zn-ribbon protein involved in translation (DUF1610 family)
MSGVMGEAKCECGSNAFESEDWCGNFSHEYDFHCEKCGKDYHTVLVRADLTCEKCRENTARYTFVHYKKDEVIENLVEIECKKCGKETIYVKTSSDWVELIREKLYEREKIEETIRNDIKTMKI